MNAIEREQRGVCYEMAVMLTRMGVSVIPIEPGTKEPPVGFRWGEYTTRIADASEIYEWFEVKRWQIGVVCGPVSGHLVVIDFDRNQFTDGGYRDWASRHPAIHQLPRSMTGKRRIHVFFRSTEPTDKYVIGEPGDQVEVRSGNHYVVIPPSIHPETGQPYRWSERQPIANGIPTIDMRTIGFEPRRRGDADREPGSEGNPLSDDEIARLVEFVSPFWKEGQRHNLALALSGWMAGYSVPEIDAHEVIGALAAHEPPSERRDFLKTVETTYARWREGFAVAGWSMLTDRVAPLINRAAATQLDWLLKPRQATIVFRKATPTDDGEPEEGVTVDDFRAYMPEHKYIFLPGRDLWPASSVNARLGLLGSGNRLVAASTWLDRNAPVEQMTWAPGEPTLIEGRLIAHGGWIRRKGLTCFNLYRPPTIEAGNADGAARWVEHVYRVYPAEAEHIISWLAHRVQRPGQKINHALVLGGQQGIGKDTLLEPVKHAVGPWNSQEVSPVQLLGRFNAFVKSVILRVSEARDLGEIDRYAFYEHMKVYTAAPPDVLRCDEKNVREYSVLNVCGCIITTNHKTDGIYLPSDDRRHFVAWSEATMSDFDADYWSNLYSWYEADGYGDVYAYLLSLDLSDFNPKAPPPKTQAFWDIVDANRAPEDAELADALDTLFSPGAVTIETVAGHSSVDFAAWLNERKNRRQIPHRMEAMGYVPVRNPFATDGLWKIGSRRQVVYARRDLPPQDRIDAASDLRGR